MSLRLTLRLALGAAVLVAVVVHVGAAPFLQGVAALDAPALGAAVALTALATAAAAWRWRTVSRGLGIPLAWGTAVGMYYRSQLVNSVLPGGVLGDVRRAVDHGRTVERMGPAARAVAIERGVGQAVQVALAIPVVVAAGMGLGSGVLPSLALIAGVGGVAVALALLVALASARVRRLLRREAAELRAALGSASAIVQTVAASVVVCLSHVATFAVATIAVGAQVSPLRLIGLAFVVLLAASLPIGVGGWGPREGVAGWAFAAAGLGASAGVAAATLFGVLALLALVPGAVLSAVVHAGVGAAAPAVAPRVGAPTIPPRADAPTGRGGA